MPIDCCDILMVSVPPNIELPDTDSSGAYFYEKLTSVVGDMA